MKVYTLLLCLLISQLLFSQSQGKITYNETFKLDIQIDGLDQAMLDMIPKSQSLQKELIFSGKKSIFQDSKGEAIEDVNMSSDDGSFQLKIVMGDEVANVLYKDLKSKEKVEQKGIMGKPFIIKDKLDRVKWKFSNEKVKYLDYECQKATFEDGEDFVVAWYTAEIPLQVGPDKYHGLPGAILMLSLNEDELEYKATKVDFYEIEEGVIEMPTDGKEVSEEEYKKILKEKEDEMVEMHTKTRTRTIGH